MLFIYLKKKGRKKHAMNIETRRRRKKRIKRKILLNIYIYDLPLCFVGKVKNKDILQGKRKRTKTSNTKWMFFSSFYLILLIFSQFFFFEIKLFTKFFTIYSALGKRRKPINKSPLNTNQCLKKIIERGQIFQFSISRI